MKAKRLTWQDAIDMIRKESPGEVNDELIDKISEIVDLEETVDTEKMANGIADMIMDSCLENGKKAIMRMEMGESVDDEMACDLAWLAVAAMTPDAFIKDTPDNAVGIVMGLSKIVPALDKIKEYYLGRLARSVAKAVLAKHG
jgi:hypothetical protein